MSRTSSSQAGEVQVSAEVLSSLISSVEEFRKNVSTLQVEKTEIESAIESLLEKVVELHQQHANDKVKINNMGLQLQALRPRQRGRVFALFLTFPMEVRL
jgi:peptidoglycan hydrolase CwlO-like protein